MPRKPRQNRRRRGLSARKVVTLGSKGTKIRNPISPPQFTAAPWYALTIAVTAAKAAKDGTSCFTVANAIAAWQDQTGVKFPGLCLRFQELHIWCYDADSVMIAVDETPDGTQCGAYSDSVTILECYKSNIRLPGVSYRWPLTTRQQVKTAAELNTVLFRYTVKTGAILLLHLHVLWSFGQSTSPKEMIEVQFQTCRPHGSMRVLETEASDLASDFSQLSC